MLRVWLLNIRHSISQNFFKIMLFKMKFFNIALLSKTLTSRKLSIYSGFAIVISRTAIYHALFSIMLFVDPAYGLNKIPVNLLFEITNELSEPSDVTVSKEGLIYIVDGVNNKIRIYDKKGKGLSAFGEGGSGRGEFKFPLGIDIDNSGKVYVADSGNHRIQIFNSLGKFIAEIPLTGGKIKTPDPTDVAVDETRNRIYVVDNDNHKIRVYNLLNYKLEKSFGAPGTRELKFRYPFLMALDKDQYLYIVDVINTRVQVLNPDGLFVTFIGGWGVKKGQFFRPKGVALDKGDRVYVSDSYMGVIQVFDTTGELLGVISDTTDDKVKKFKTPTGLYVDNYDRLYVVEMLAQKVSVFRIEYNREQEI